MPFYCVNMNAQPNGDHEVHDTGNCTRLPLPANRLDRGYHAGCASAVRETKKSYSTANGCAYCSPECNSG